MAEDIREMWIGLRQWDVELRGVWYRRMPCVLKKEGSTWVNPYPIAWPPVGEAVSFDGWALYHRAHGEPPVLHGKLEAPMDLAKDDSFEFPPRSLR